MISGLSAQGQAGKALEMVDLLRSRGLIAKFRPKTDNTAISVDIPSQIEKLATLRDKGLITETEYTAKKTDLLERM